MAVTHYFTDNRSLPENRKDHSFEFMGHAYTFATEDGVFSKTGVDYGSEVLLKAAARERIAGNVLDMGCGYGVLGIVLKTLFPDAAVTCCDVNPRAAELADANSKTNRAPVSVIISDRFEHVPGMFDVIVTNPPIRAGKEVVYGIFDGAYEHLSSDGILLVVIRRKQGAESAVRKLNERFGNCEIVMRDKGYWILKSRKSD